MKINPNNIFYKNRKDIQAASVAHHVDTDTATRIWAAEHLTTNHPEEMAEWKALIRYYDKHKTLTQADLFK